MQEKAYPEINERVISKKLGNGLEIKIVPKPGFTKAYAMLGVKYGSIDACFETNGGVVVPPKGVAHFLEHKVFEQPDGGNALQIFAQTGASPNAFTSKAMTAYHFSCTDYFDRNLEILLDFVTTPHFTDENVSKEQGIIGQEIGMVNDKPHFKVYENLMAALYQNHPAKDSIIGTIESIGQITRKTLMDCYHTFYIPSNMVLTVAGDVNAERIISAAEGMLPREYKKPPKRDYGKEPLKPAQKAVREEMECNLPIFAIGFKMPAETMGMQGIKLRLIAELAAELLFGTSSPFYADMYREGLINNQFGAEPMFFPNSVALMISGESNDPETVTKRILDQVCDMEDAYFERVKRAVYGVKMRYFDHFGILCREMATGTFGDYDYFDSFALFKNIKKHDIMIFIQKFLRENSMAISMILPK